MQVLTSRAVALPRPPAMSCTIVAEPVIPTFSAQPGDTIWKVYLLHCLPVIYCVSVGAPISAALTQRLTLYQNVKLVLLTRHLAGNA